MEFNANSVPVPQKENSKTDMKPHVPQELISPILLRLPVKPLCRFKSVSKSFQALIDDKHKPRRKMFFKETLTKLRTKSTAFWVCDMDDGSEEKISFPNYRSAGVEFVGYCKGLFLLARGDLNLIIWNPSTKQYRNLPTCPWTLTNMGLGYDSVSNDYEVVSIPNKDGYEAWVYELRSNVWRRIDCEIFPDADAREIFIECFAHGSLYWLYESPTTGLKEIAAFDVAKEKSFRVICPVKGSITGLHVLDGSLCVSVYSDTTLVEEAHIYVTKKDGDDYFWHKICSVTSEQELFFDIECFEKVKVIGYLKEGDKIMMDVGLDHMISYDLKKNSFEKTDVAGGCKFFIQAIMFTESHASVGAGTTTEVLEPVIKRNEEINTFHNSDIYHMLCIYYRFR